MKKIIKSLTVLTLCGASATNITACHVTKERAKPFSPQVPQPPQVPQRPTEAPKPTTVPQPAPMPPTTAPVPQRPTEAPKPTTVPQPAPKPPQVPQRPTEAPKPPQVPQPAPKPPQVPQRPTEEKETAIKLNQQVAQDLRLINEHGESLVKIGIYNKRSSDYVEWDFIELNSLFPYGIYNIKDITAADLLNNNDTAVSQESEEFLINTLELTKNATDNTFNRDDADLIRVSISKSEIKPIVSKTADGSDYEVTGGTFKLQFVKQGKNLGYNYTIDLKRNELNIKYLVNRFWFDNDDFNPIPDFELGKDNTKPINGTPIYQYLDQDSYVYKRWESLKKLLIDTGDKVSIIVTSRDITGKNWIRGDSLKVKIKFGTITNNTLIALYPS